MESEEFKGRKAPYAPVSAVDEFFEKMRNVSVPARVDQRFLQKLNIGASNEWALLSALKFLGIVDQQGVPTHAYRLLQSTDKFQDTLRHLVETAYAPLLEAGGADMSLDDLANYFRVTSSPSQAKNAARFFRALSRRSGTNGPIMQAADSSRAEPEQTVPRVNGPAPLKAHPARVLDATVLGAKAKLLEKLPFPREDWTAAEYGVICEKFLEMLRHLDV